MVDAKLGTMPYQTGATCIGAAINHALRLFSDCPRPGAPKYLIFVSDGCDDCMQTDYPTIPMAKEVARAQGVHVASIGVGGEGDPHCPDGSIYNTWWDTLRAVASDNSSVYTMETYDLSQLADKIRAEVLGEICPNGTAPIPHHGPGPCPPCPKPAPAPPKPPA